MTKLRLKFSMMVFFMSKWYNFLAEFVYGMKSDSLKTSLKPDVNLRYLRYMKPTGHFDEFTIKSWEKNTNCKVNNDSKPMYFELHNPITKPSKLNPVPTHKTIEIVVNVAMF
jgi:hypothetical protein